MKEELRKHIGYWQQWIKTELKNKMELLAPQQQIEFLNVQLQMEYLAGLIKQLDKETEQEGKNICNTIIAYRKEQNTQEKISIDAQEKIGKNATNIFEHMMEET